MWVFGYGSLLWYQDFPFDQKVSGVVKGYSRRFWQRSPDHRGTPDSPGRTVTLIKDEKDVCWGIAFKVPDEHVTATKAYLDHREKAGYTCVSVLFHPDQVNSIAGPFDVCVYMNVADNEHHAGPSELDDIANTIIRSHGPSGSNLEYLLRLAIILDNQAPHTPDPHIQALVSRVIDLSKKTGLGADVLKRLGYDL